MGSAIIPTEEGQYQPTVSISRGVNEMSGLGSSNGNTPKPGALVTGDPGDEIRRSACRLAKIARAQIEQPNLD